MAVAALLEPLLACYRAEPLRRLGRSYPALLLDQTAAPLLMQAPERTLRPPARWGDPERLPLIVDEPGYPEELRAQGRTVGPGLCYRMTSISGSGASLRVGCDLGRYDLMLRSSETLAREAHTCAAFDPADPLAALPLRAALQHAVADPLRDGTGRHAALACSVLLAAADPAGGYRLHLRRRSQQVATYPGRLHVQPSFMLSPAQAGIGRSLNLAGQVRREYAEELFAHPEDEDAETHPAVAELYTLLGRGEAHLHRSGLAVDLWNLRPELLCLLVINDPGWLARHMPGSPLPFRDGFEVAAASAPPSVCPDWSDERIAAVYALDPETSVPTGAASFWLGLDLLRRLR